MAYTDDEELRTGLMEDLVKTREISGRSAPTPGSPQEILPDYEVAAIRTPRKTIAQKELRNTEIQFDNFAKQLSEEAQFTDDIQQAKFQNSLKQRLRQAQLEIMKRAEEFDFELKKKGYDQERRQAFLKGVQGSTSNIFESIVSNSYRSSKKQQSTISSEREQSQDQQGLPDSTDYNDYSVGDY